MIWGSMGRRPRLIRDYVVSMSDGPWILNHVSKIWRLLGDENRYNRSNISTQGFAKLVPRDFTSTDHRLLKPHSP